MEDVPAVQLIRKAATFPESVFNKRPITMQGEVPRDPSADVARPAEVSHLRYATTLHREGADAP